MLFFDSRCASKVPMGMQSSRRTSHSIPYLLYFCSIAAVRICQGYVYFGNSLLFSALIFAIALSISRPSSGAVLAITELP